MLMQLHLVTSTISAHIVEMLNDAIFFILIAIAASAWVQANRATRKFPSRFARPKATWQIANTLAKTRHQNPAPELARDKKARSLSPLSFW
jgi:hypothetical protein